MKLEDAMAEARRTKPLDACDPELTHDIAVNPAASVLLEEIARLRRELAELGDMWIRMRTAIHAGMDPRTGELNIVALCRKIEGVSCFCGCHTSIAMDSGRKEQTEAKAVIEKLRPPTEGSGYDTKAFARKTGRI